MVKLKKHALNFRRTGSSDIIVYRGVSRRFLAAAAAAGD